MRSFASDIVIFNFMVHFLSNNRFFGRTLLKEKAPILSTFLILHIIFYTTKNSKAEKPNRQGVLLMNFNKLETNCNKSINLFQGPLFIIGMPRSGTKLLRGILNEHPRISIPDIETQFLPTWITNWDTYGNLSDKMEFNRFYNKMIKLPYFLYMKENGRLIESQVWYNQCVTFSVSGVFEALIRHDANVPFGTIGIWGDKSPSYINYFPLIKKTFPHSRFIHIVRDVRDYCLSINKAWGKNMIRAAQRWFDGVQFVEINSKPYNSDLLVIKYEDLISSTHSVIKKVCDFLTIQFVPDMLLLSKPTENKGDAVGLYKIKADNRDKYKRLMKKKTLHKIEEITVPMLKLYGYDVPICYEHKRLKSKQMLYYKIIDGINLFRYEIKERGIKNTVKWNLPFFKVNR
ncbi:sulfotransferase [candidate division WS5 bacterium]|uniref:Sulfotransferase n=1 Tax=candidate division WS5 bacterium TaxID=2093353 RepID=A0A419DAM9_9BACT|nr:MAG: sulfotransferase [candidate division WS5 bacterium]